MVILEGIWYACIIMGIVVPIALLVWALVAGIAYLGEVAALIALFSWALAEGIAYLGEAVVRWWKNS